MQQFHNLGFVSSIPKDIVLSLGMDETNPRKRGRLVRQRWVADLNAYGGRKARQSFTYDAFVPDPIVDLNPLLPADVALIVGEAEQAVRQLNAGPAVADLEAIARQLLRAESVASSRIEGLALSQRRLAEAIFAPDRSDITAVSVLNNIAAMDMAIRLGSEARPFVVGDIRTIHRTLLNTPIDQRIAGAVRTTQNWIGGRATTPLGAQFIPPPASEVPALLDDLCAFINRDDLPAVAQAVIAHAQFETIHPFADGNGRVGRCLIHVVLRRRGVAARYVPPVSVILATNASAYIAGLTDYRAGDVAGWCALFATALRTAGDRALALTVRLQELQAEWRERAGRPRRDSTASKILALLPAYPIMNVETARALAGVSDEAARVALQTLEQAGILSQVSVGRRNRAWTAKELFGVVNAFEWDIATPDDPAETRRPSPTARRSIRPR